jgi:hypothetical protein
VRGGLVGNRIGLDAASHQLRQHLRGISEHADRDPLLRAGGPLDHRQRLIQIPGTGVEIACVEPHLDARWLAFDRQQRRACHCGR